MYKIAILCLAALALSGCSTQAQRTLVTVGCVVDSAVPVAAATAGAIATITNPADVGLVLAASKADQPVHALIQQACQNALAGSKPIPDTINAVDVPVAAAVSQTTLAILPVTAAP